MKQIYVMKSYKPIVWFSVYLYLFSNIKELKCYS